MEITREQKELADRQRREFDDLQNEIAGRETGRRARFLKDGPGSESAKQKEREARRALTRLAELLNDPVYRAKYDGVMTALQDAERATETALERITREIDAIEDDIAGIQDRAARLPDGTRVYRDADGNLHREDGIVKMVQRLVMFWRPLLSGRAMNRVTRTTAALRIGWMGC